MATLRKHIESALDTLSIQKLKNLIKKFNIKTSSNSKRDIINSIISYIRTTGKYKEVLTDNLKFDTSKYLDRKKKIFINHPEKRKNIKKLFDSYDLKFNKDTKDFEAKQDKKIKREVKLKKIFKPDYKIIETRGEYIKKYRTYRKTYRVVENNKLRPEQYSNILRDLFSKAIGSIQGKVDIIVHNPKLDRPFHPHMMSTKEAYDVYLETLTNKIEYKELDITECIFDFNVIELPQGGYHSKIHNDDDSITNKRSICQIKNNDNLCLARSIVTALSIQNSELLCNKLSHEKLTPNQLKYIKQGRLLQKVLAVKLHELCNIPLEICNLEQVKIFEEFFDIQINIFCRENFNERIYSGKYKSICIYIYKNRNHFDVITSIKGFLGRENYCEFCQVSYKRSNQHRCPLKCDRCFKSNSKFCNGEEKGCKKCNRYFKGSECYTYHKEKDSKGVSVCNTLWKCLKCKRILNTFERKPKLHQCGEHRCKNCRKWVMSDHKCYMKNVKAKGGKCENDCTKNIPFKKGWCEICKYEYTEKYMFFDIETIQETGIHEVNLVINQDFKGSEVIFDNEDEYCKWLFRDKHYGYTVLAHYGKGFDFQFLAKYCFKNKIRVFTIYQGNKLTYMQAPEFNIRFIDSINFTMIPLRDFPKTFGLNELAKGWFPHYFNKKCNQNYVGKYPEKHYYGYDSMKEKERNQFLDWYKTVKNETFDFQKEFIKYCRSDVDILRRGCLELREKFLEIANIDPFKYVTLAGLCMGIFRSKFLKEDTIAIDIDEIQNDKYSKKSIAWLDYISETQNINIKHALNGGEKKIKLGKKTYKVDGFFDNTVYQFQGCHWHGCYRCYRESTINPQNQICMKDLYKRTKRINKKIIKNGYKLIEMWECDFDNNKDIKKYIKNVWNRDFVTPLNPRDAFYGGRCEPTKLKYEMNNNEKGRYIDVCSLYPTVNFFDNYPIGHPNKIFNPKKYDKKWYGLIKCKVLPPKKLYHPVLPYKGEKLLFTLCKSCSQTIKCKHFKSNQTIEKKRCKDCYELRNKKCQHTDNERAFIGTWTTDEIKLAIKKGYNVLNIYEVWNFENKTNELFKEYVKMFLKIKLETDDKLKVRKDFKSREEYKIYIKDYKKLIKEKLDIKLDKVKKNPGLRFIAKICLNSLWGKFGQRKDMPQKEYVMELDDFYRIILDDNIKELNMIFMNDDCVEMSYKMKNEYVKNNFNTNIYIASFTTSSARIRLYKMLNKLGDKVLYYDTDSIIYIDDGTNKIETGCLLGDWTDELGPNKYIKMWLSGASKDYGYILNDETVHGKVKGFKMSYENENVLTFDERMKVITGETDYLEISNNQFKIEKDRNIVVNKLNKRYMFGYNKRRILDNYDTVPFGF